MFEPSNIHEYKTSKRRKEEGRRRKAGIRKSTRAFARSSIVESCFRAFFRRFYLIRLTMRTRREDSLRLARANPDRRNGDPRTLRARQIAIDCARFARMCSIEQYHVDRIEDTAFAAEHTRFVPVQLDGNAIGLPRPTRSIYLRVWLTLRTTRWSLPKRNSPRSRAERSRKRRRKEMGNICFWRVECPRRATSMENRNGE